MLLVFVIRLGLGLGKCKKAGERSGRVRVGVPFLFFLLSSPANSVVKHCKGRAVEIRVRIKVRVKVTVRGVRLG